jgi:hypothetical protein
MKPTRSAIDQIEFTRNLLAFVLVGAFVTIIPLFVYKAIPAGNKEVVAYMAGQLSGMATMALGFYFVNKVGQDALDAKRTENTGKALEAIKATAEASAAPVADVTLAPGETATVEASKSDV